MPSKKKKYNARFPAGRIKKIMQSDEEIGKVAQAVPVIISKTLELFVESLLTKTMKITNSRNAKTLSTSHMKQCIMSEQRFDFLRELVKNIPDISVAEEAANYNEEDAQSSPEEQYPDSDTPTDLSMPSTSLQASRAAAAAAAAAINANTTTQITNGAGSVYQRSYSEGGMLTAPRPAHTNRSGPVNLKRSDHPTEASNYSTRRPYMPTNSVIMHTTHVLKAGDCLPAKLSRSDSSPATVAAAVAKATVISSSSSRHSQRVTSHNPAPPAAAIPAPIVSFDFCNKPIVKIDYSNLPLAAAANSTAAVATATPATTTTELNASGALATVEPVINIDLSNLCTTAAMMPLIATVDSNASRNPKATKNSFLELDEDYDNI